VQAGNGVKAGRAGFIVMLAPPVMELVTVSVAVMPGCRGRRRGTEGPTPLTSVALAGRVAPPSVLVK